MTLTERAPRADAERNRRLVLEAGSRTFAERGAAATLNDVARAAGVGVGTVYRNFADKDALLDALFAEKIAGLVRLAEASATFEKLLRGVMEARATDRGLDAILTSPSRSTRFADELSVVFIPAVQALVETAVSAGELRLDFAAPEVCLLGYMVGTVADVTRETDPDLWRRYAQLLIDGTRPSPVPLSPAALGFEAMAAALGRAS